jgi:hypothetical protein
MYLTDATILSEEGSREVLEEMARPPKDTPQRRRTFAGARLVAEMWTRQSCGPGNRPPRWREVRRKRKPSPRECAGGAALDVRGSHG